MKGRCLLFALVLAAGTASASIPPAGTFCYGYDAQRSTLPTTVTLPNSAWTTNHYDSLARLDYTALVNRWGHVLDGYAYTHDLLGLRTNIVRNLGLTSSRRGGGKGSGGGWSGCLQEGSPAIPVPKKPRRRP